MPPAAYSPPSVDRTPIVSAMTTQESLIPSETFARDSIIAWFRGEFAAANAIIDALCNHLTQLDEFDGHGAEYESVFAAIHRRRLNWIPILQMQKYYSIADVALELRKVAAKKRKMREEREKKKIEVPTVFFHEEIDTVKEENDVPIENKASEEEFKEIMNRASEEEIVNGASLEEVKEVVNGAEEVKNRAVDGVAEEDSLVDDQSDRKANDEAGSQGEQLPVDRTQICSNHEDCENRRAQIKTTKGFVAKELVKGHMVNVVKGLKLYEDIFIDSELSKLKSFVNQLRLAGRNGELSGETFSLFNEQLKGNKREIIQLGVPIFRQIKDETNSKCQRKGNIEPIPPVLQAIIDHLVQWHLIPESRKPNSCIINFFDEGEYSQPYLKPPHLDQPTSTLLLSESTMAFGRVLMGDHQGNYKGTLVLSIKEGSLLIMRGNSADMARQVICASSNKRISITFSKVRLDTHQMRSSNIPPLTKAMTLWQSEVPQPYPIPNTYKEPMDMVPEWGVLHAPVVMLAPVRPMIMHPRRIPRGSGTGVFLPWTVGPKKPARHLPPRAQKGRLLALTSPVESQAGQLISGTKE